VDKLMVLQEGGIQAFGPRDDVLGKLRQTLAPAQIAAGGDA
jgi:ABC-type protease/lipase transport system fused ATPase/permease subunit